MEKLCTMETFTCEYNTYDEFFIPIRTCNYTNYRKVKDFLNASCDEMHDWEFPNCLTRNCKLHCKHVYAYYKTMKKKPCSCGKIQWYQKLKRMRDMGDLESLSVYMFDCNSSK